ncbi:unnamed protein product [Rotaria sordida]|uniref:SID1 transmembrane family member 1 n=4 Tax=Rotaria sordida TaxID=392033 RepID=A0A819J1J4_9BILA|nr:unnamed protein product [Rotaria sordida]CAF3925113.1 unnamed protein product [Rotaria sordida]
MLSLLIYLFLSVIIIHGDQNVINSIQSIINPDIEIKNCTFGEICNGTINSTSVHFYSVEYSFDPTMAIRVITNMTYKIEQEAPLVIVVRQIRGVISWTLPYTFSNGMIYSSASRILCLQNEINRTHPHTSRVFIEISTSNTDWIDYSLQLENITEFLLETGVSRQFFVSPAMPIYYKFTFPSTIENVFINVRSSDQLCTIVSVQSFDCPVYDVSEIGMRQGHYQTMASIASFNVYASEFPKRNTFLLVFLVQPTDADCLNDQEQTIIRPAGVIDVQRQKNATVTIHPPANYNFLYIAIFITIGLFLLIYFVAFTIMCKHADIYDHLAPDQLPLLEAIAEREIAERNNNQRGYQTFQGEENVVSTSESENEQSGGAIEVIATSNVGFVTVSDLCVKDYDYSKQKFRIYPQTMLTIAIFYSLPVIQLVLQYQLNINSSGNEDLCYFNFLCIRQFAMLTAFNSVFSNIGYCALGLLFLIIVYRRDMAYARFLTKYPAIGKEYGIPQHFGLFYAMGIGLFMEGLMSGCYHICPSKQNFQFDTSFMFIVAVLNIIKIYQTRHPDINPHSAGSFSFLAAIILITVIGVYYDEQWFWIAYAIIHILACLAFTGKIYYMGRLKVTFRVHIHLYRLVKEHGFFSRPRYLNRMMILIPANCINIAFALYGAIIQPESFPNHLLFVFLGNLAIYLMYYILMKIIHRENFTRFSIVFLLLAILFWSSSLYFFYQQVKSYEVQPAISRMRNRPCILLNTFDVHDIWHLLSSFSLFFSFLTLLTLDDGIRKEKRKELAAF